MTYHMAGVMNIQWNPADVHSWVPGCDSQLPGEVAGVAGGASISSRAAQRLGDVATWDFCIPTSWLLNQLVGNRKIMYTYNYI